jgi:hypothetical protein
MDDDEYNDEPIVLGGPPEENEFAVPPESEPTYLGDINEAPSNDEPIVLMGPSGSDDFDDMPSEMENMNISDEPTPMQKWSTEWQETLKVRKDEENARKAELLEAARIALEEFVQTREQKRESNMSRNREDEQAKLEAIEADLENDNSWQRVCKMVELSHDSTAKAEDVKRMRDVLILLKNEPTRAEALST